ncbi:MAG: hypothetical protein KBT29_01575 [Prevotellaceae bacterium]|nr:hypothetical protein [Candidatus Minthosoma caballi]
MKKIILSLIVMLMTVSAMAQGFQRREFNPKEMATRQAEQIKNACNLSDEQYKSVCDLLIKNAEKMKVELDSIQAAGGDFRQSFDREKMRKRNEEQNAAIKALLNEEQVAAYEKMQAERRQRFGGGGPR